ncbi:hypothetical protein GCM10023088_09960 [Actinomadura verrucosospora]
MPLLAAPTCRKTAGRAPRAAPLAGLCAALPGVGGATAILGFLRRYRTNPGYLSRIPYSGSGRRPRAARSLAPRTSRMDAVQ